MAKIHSLCLVIALSVLGCKEQTDFPLDILISTSCTEFEMISIRQAVDEANMLGQELINQDTVIIAGRFDGSEDHLNINDLNDDFRTLTCQHEPSEGFEDYLNYTSTEGDDLLGTGFFEWDVFIYVFNLRYQGEVLEDEEDVLECPLPKDWPKDLKLPDGETCPIKFRHVVLHEMGHFIGLGHLDVKDEDTVMRPRGSGSIFFSEIDKTQFCCIYECWTTEYACSLGSVPVTED